ncbi:TOBE domain-containing protein [Nocardia sp. NPDC058666]|uniref:TOBE domain-containing protein n=1 Tax=Nocardia sp. NPDC058666 TaxID=3346587 RepID=UPI003647EE00
MNLFPAVVTSTDGHLRLIADGVDAALDITEVSGDATAVVAGIRPERLRIDDTSGDVRGRVRMVENLGSEELVHLESGLCLRAARPAGVRVGEDIACRVDPSDIHLFDPDTGLRLTWQASQPLSKTAAVPVP